MNFFGYGRYLLLSMRRSTRKGKTRSDSWAGAPLWVWLCMDRLRHLSVQGSFPSTAVCCFCHSQVPSPTRLASYFSQGDRAWNKVGSERERCTLGYTNDVNRAREFETASLSSSSWTTSQLLLGLAFDPVSQSEPSLPSPKTWIRRFFAISPIAFFEMLKVPTLSWLGCVSQLAEGKGRTATEAKDRQSPVPVFEGIEKKQGMSWVVGKRSHVYMNASGSRALGWSKEDSSHLAQREENGWFGR